ncbi:PREDICTED: putative sodium-dependent multivitamin transporter [Polistes canadensis]|uniref:putative sodium-dependent multivitamin transporter n=1 Tax=Polistes canadensis TaxID=91411 RepID=UPI000718BE53|nr:PREDICTED: putative sodium-dependent multivitamin transporter [Polistes canadensis]
MDEQITENSTSTLQWPDYLVLGTVLSISASIGIYYRFTGGRQRTAEEYFSADRSMKIVPLAIALMVSFMSAITLLGISAEAYTHGMMFIVVYIGFGVGTPITMYLYLPVFFELKIMSVFEYLERRFGVKARLLASIANFCHLTLYTGIVLYAPSLALEATTGLSSTMSIILIGVICTFYSTIGGIKAVLITDVFQGVLMFLSIFCIITIGAGDLPNGLYDVWNRAMRGGRIDFTFYSLDLTTRHTWWGLLTGGCCMFLSLFAVNQVQVQRLLTVKSLRDSRLALILNWPIMLALATITIFSGLVIYAIYEDCDPVKSGRISSSDKLMPLFAAERLSRVPGFTGLFVAGVFSASLSTISAMLNSLSAVALEDYIKPIYSKIGVTFPEEKATLLGKLLAVTNGLSCIFLALIAGKLGTLIEAAIGLIGVIGGPLLGIFTLGMFLEDANEIGAIVGMTFALILGFSMACGPKVSGITLPMSIDGCDNSTLMMFNKTIGLNSTLSNDSNVPYLNRISYIWYPVIGFVMTVIIGYLSSLIINKFIKDRREPDPNLFTPFVAARIKRRRQDEQRVTSSQMFVLEPNYRK